MPLDARGFQEIRPDRNLTDWSFVGLELQLRCIYGLRVTTPTRNTSRMASTLVLLAIALRILLPGLHTHSHATLPTAVEFAVASETPCSCGVIHETADRRSTDGSGGDRHELPLELLGEHHCLACEIQLGKPCGCPPVPPSLAEETLLRQAAVACPCTLEVVHAVGLPRPRAPPDDEA